MSSAETSRARVIKSRRSLVRGLSLVLALAPMLAACGNSGFRPLYGATPSGAGLQERLAQLDVAAIPGRVGQRIRNELVFQSSGGGELLPPTHRLEVSITESVLTTLVTPLGDSAGQIYALQANFKLVDIKTKQVVLQGTSHGRAAFERFTNTSTVPGQSGQWTYSNVRARDDAENRAARVVADDLKTRVAIYLSGHA
jgi:LPS-assembly lipoprotein